MHLCSANCFRKLSCASAVFLRESGGTLKALPQSVQTPTAGTGPSHLTTRRLRFSMAQFPIGPEGLAIPVKVTRDHYLTAIHSEGLRSADMLYDFVRLREEAFHA